MCHFIVWHNGGKLKLHLKGDPYSTTPSDEPPHTNTNSTPVNQATRGNGAAAIQQAPRSIHPGAVAVDGPDAWLADFVLAFV